MASASLLKVNFVNQVLNRYSNFNLQTYPSIVKILPLTRILFSVATLSVAAALPSQAQTTPQALTNGDFETQSTQLTANGQQGALSTLTGFQVIPGGTVTNSGVQYGTAKPANTGGAGQVAESGNSFVYEKGGDSGIFQITGSVLAANEQVTLTWYAANSYQNPIQRVNILTEASTSTTFAGATAVAMANGSANAAYTLPAYAAGKNPGPYTMFTLTYNTTAADVGNDVGISIENTATTAANSFANFDNFDLAITTVPEPETWVAGLLTVGMAAGLIITRFRKQTLSKSVPV